MAVIYLRVSTKDQAGRGGEAEGFSIPAQREACLRKAESMGAVVVAEFVDAGASARSANRPELQNMLGFVAEHKVAHVIVHKVDRLARNRADDVDINLQLTAAGAQLVSCTENIDETPSGLLLHGIMSSIAEFYSRNLAAESKKGMRQKAKGGGTTGMAPFGYINSRERMADGREIKTVALDPERASWVTWLYEKYATGEWTSAMLRDELNKQGVMTLQRPNRPSRPIAVSHVDSILRNRYYLGLVKFEGVEYPGQHPALVSEKLFQEVQRVRAARHQSGEKPRMRSHYLKGSVYCGQCGEPLTFAQSRNRTGTTYDYFVCLGRNSLKNGCTFRAVQAHQLEELVAEHWATISLRPGQIAKIRGLVLEHLGIVMPSTTAVREARKSELDSLDRDSQKVLDAFYADAIETHELKKEQVRIAARRAAIQTEVAKFDLDEGLITSALERCLDLLTNAQSHYNQTDDLGRRDLNQATFSRIYVHDDEIVASDLEPAFRRLMSDSLESDLASERKTTQKRLVRTNDLYVVPEVGDSVHRGRDTSTDDLPAKSQRTAPQDRFGAFLNVERPRGHLLWEKKEPRPSKDRGSNELLLVAGTGFEPVTSGL
ncbi:recombinase family protein [Aeromicrobium sp. Root344]|uniref:recombinase family protein n=1 Tax=Aeromicrobium sp. Root344 TaxID=1736521 RepID=UPI003FA4879C